MLALVLLIAVGGAAHLYSRLAASLARTSGEAPIPGLTAPVRVEVDAHGTPRILAENELDALRAQGFCDAQERFFQMDLARRHGAGELSALFGPEALASDKRLRAFRFRSVARRFLESCPERHRARLDAYAQGVNAGLADLDAPPPEYLALRATAREWTPEDSMMVFYGFFDLLSMDPPTERQQAALEDALPAALASFLTPDTTRWDAPLLTDESPGNAPARAPGYEVRGIPGPDVVNLRAGPTSGARPAQTGALDPREGARASGALGSNSWAVGGSRTSDGRAILACDPHLPLLVPAIWRRVQLEWPGVRLAGASTPGIPGVVMGATDAVAWGFTNVCGDFEDLIVVETQREDPGLYRTPDTGALRWERFGEIVEVIDVRGGEPVELRLRTTRWGVMTGEDPRGRPLVLKWSALAPAMHNLDIFDMPAARTLEEAIQVLRGAWIPPQNALVVSRDGRLAWVMVGRLPRREGFDGRTPASWATAGVGWKGEAPRRPMMVDPPGGALFTANQRTTPPEWSRTIGRMWANPARAARVREMLASRERFDEDAMRAMQQDTRADLVEWYRGLALGAVPSGSGDASVRRAGALVESWNGRADADQPGFRILKEFRRTLLRSAIDPLVAPCVAKDPSFTFVWWLSDETLARLLEERPEHLLSPRYADWDALTREAFASAVASIERGERDRDAPGLEAPWGEVNRARLEHPLARALPALAPLLNMPELPLSGDTTVVRVATSTYGAGMRFVASPSNLDEATLTIAGGQSGHFLSPHYRSDLSAWADGGATPLLAGAARSSFRLVPTPGAPGGPASPLVAGAGSAGAAPR